MRTLAQMTFGMLSNRREWMAKYSATLKRSICARSNISFVHTIMQICIRVVTMVLIGRMSIPGLRLRTRIFRKFIICRKSYLLCIFSINYVCVCVCMRFSLFDSNPPHSNKISVLAWVLCMYLCVCWVLTQNPVSILHTGRRAAVSHLVGNTNCSLYINGTTLI